MISAIGFVNSMYGDMVMATVCARAFKKQYPNSHLTFAASDKYSKILPLFNKNPNIDSFYIWDSYEKWPSENDRIFLLENKYNIIYHPQPNHIDSDWYNKRHYCAEYCMMHGLMPPNDLSCELIPFFGKNDKYKNYISISAFPSKSSQLNKTLDIDKWEYLVFELSRKGYKCIQLGGEFDIQIKGCEKPNSTFLESAQILYSSRLHVTCDTSWAWIGSAYKHNTIGLYGFNYQDQDNIQNHLPVNKNAEYLFSRSIKDIDINLIIDSIIGKS